MSLSGKLLPARALAAFIALPGMVAFVVPVWIGTSARHPLGHPAYGAPMLCLGTVLLLWCVREFYRAGRGTLAPWDPPTHLVTSGPYRFSRNPMYLGVEVILVGWCTLWGSRTLLLYTLLVMIAVYLRVRLAEEPWARRRFGAEWEAYEAKVPRWIL
jgi:protein-S-isoprenylcysteine O-methyltransferase Ste14